MGRTSIPCSEETARILREDKKRREMDWDEYLQMLAGEQGDSVRAKVDRLENRVDDLEAQLQRY
jgi:polyhydroxyalkanoate synthesis regulator phasin